MCACSRKMAERPVSGCATDLFQFFSLIEKESGADIFEDVRAAVLQELHSFGYLMLIFYLAAPAKQLKASLTASSLGPMTLMLKKLPSTSAHA